MNTKSIFLNLCTEWLLVLLTVSASADLAFRQTTKMTNSKMFRQNSGLIQMKHK